MIMQTDTKVFFSLLKRSAREMAKRARPSTWHHFQKGIWGILRRYESGRRSFETMNREFKNISGAFNPTHDGYRDDSSLMNQD